MDTTTAFTAVTGTQGRGEAIQPLRPDQFRSGQPRAERAETPPSMTR